MDAGAPAVEAPNDIRIVPYTRDRDEDARVARNDAFRDHWGSLPTQSESWAKFVGGEHFRPDLSRIAVDADGAIAAFCLASVNEDDWELLGASHAYIDLIGVVRGHRRRGLAPAVIAGALAAIADAGLQQTVLDVDTASPTGANTLYEGLGFRATERSVAFVERL
ncbi:GNAT family N-acetyltransferase [Microbacterium telephonicum]|uniref:GNAT family N-acetyltransferase n=1 Tax=Microbacterium telephonicum TaxID=1714841 RepID=UPI001F546BAF|nr:GNAT family N-acetyltransferase [Microbacterium telephonicum]